MFSGTKKKRTIHKKVDIDTKFEDSKNLLKFCPNKNYKNSLKS